MNRDLALADFLEELSIFGKPRRCFDAETSHHLSQLILNRYLVRLALQPMHLPALADLPIRPKAVIQSKPPRPVSPIRGRRRQDWKVEY